MHSNPSNNISKTQSSIEDFLDQDERKDQLRLLTAGSVDDGKSTLIGRLLFDSKKLYEDQLIALRRDSKRVGNDSRLSAKKASRSTSLIAIFRPTSASLSSQIHRDTNNIRAI